MKIAIFTFFGLVLCGSAIRENGELTQRLMDESDVESQVQESADLQKSAKGEINSNAKWFEEKCRVKGEFKSGWFRQGCQKSWDKSGRCAWADEVGCMTNCHHRRNQNQDRCDPTDCVWSESEGSCNFADSIASARAAFCGSVTNVLHDNQLTFCDGVAETAVAARALLPQGNIDIMRFMGCWYVQANIPTFLDKDSSNNIELYEWNTARSRIDVTFQYTKGGKDILSYQKGWVNNENATLWRLHPRLLWIYWPLNLDYVMFYCNENYTSSIIGYPDRSYLWIMTREVNAPAAEVQRLIGISKDNGYQEEDINIVQNDIPEKPEICEGYP